MNREQFFQSADVQQFVHFLAPHLTAWQVCYEPHHRPPFNAVGITEAVESYYWRARFTAPAPLLISGIQYGAGDVVRTVYWPETRDALVALGSGLRDATSQDNDEGMLGWAGPILEWGMGTRGNPTLAILEGWQHRAEQLRTKAELVEGILRGEGENHIEHITNGEFPWMSSGLSKIMSLSIAQGPIIFDSRVALAFGTAINAFLHTRGDNNIPAQLAIGCSADRQHGVRYRVPEITVGDSNQPFLTRDARWLQRQVKATWLAEAALANAPNVFPYDPQEVRLHKFEAALFMFGGASPAQIAAYFE